ncbi:hypothetical protein AB0L53_38015 [Nonomuraea sp. NPDC052129]|uniref:amidohydrolase family protein n=1 Tax=Nonomuraea sp. NPDC052129 TaxID=3154651 RepID=UPI00343F6A65
MPVHHQWRDRVENGTLLGPRWVIGGMLIDGSPSFWNGRGLPFHEVKTEDEARAAVRRSKEDGADFVKVYSQLSLPLYRAVVDEARRQRIPFAGHCPNMVALTRASNAGQRSFEHLLGTLFATSDREAELLRAMREVKVDPVDPLRQMGPLELRAADSYHPAKASEVFALFPGFGLHDELTMLVRAGLTPMRALQAATLEPARYLGLDDRIGTVKRENWRISWCWTPIRSTTSTAPGGSTPLSPVVGSSRPKNARRCSPTSERPRRTRRP